MGKIAITVDAVVFCHTGKKLKVLLIQRKNGPFKGKWALPGGFLEENETMEKGAKRELKEETGLDIEKLIQIRAFGKPHRDPRGRTISIAFMGKMEKASIVKAADDAEDAKWFELQQLPILAFDHKNIIEEAQLLL